MKAAGHLQYLSVMDVKIEVCASFNSFAQIFKEFWRNSTDSRIHTEGSGVLLLRMLQLLRRGVIPRFSPLSIESTTTSTQEQIIINKTQFIQHHKVFFFLMFIVVIKH